MRSRLAATLALLAGLSISGGVASAQEFGIKVKKPVFGGACKVCPWGAMGDIVKKALQSYGYDVQVCYNCSGADAPRIVGDAKMPPPIRRALATGSVSSKPGSRSASRARRIRCDRCAISLAGLSRNWRVLARTAEEEPALDSPDPVAHLPARCGESGIGNYRSESDQRKALAGSHPGECGEPSHGSSRLLRADARGS